MNTAWPQVSRDVSEIADMRPSPYLGWDWEWSIRTQRPTILGISDGKTIVSALHEEAFPYLQALLQQYPNTILVGHNVLQADLQVAANLGWNIDAMKVEDTIVRHWLGNLHLCKNSRKSDDGEGEKRGRGWMNLWAFCSMYTDCANWKACVGEEQCMQEARPCPVHDSHGYNGLDAYWPVVALPKLLQQSRLRGVDVLYPLHRDVSLVLAQMTREGIFVDRTYVDALRQEFADTKRKYWDTEAGTGLLPFNPDSPKQVRAYFATQGIVLEDSTEDTINEALESHSTVPELQMLSDFKQLGDGPDRWFAPLVWNDAKGYWDGYLDDNDFIHPSFTFFTSSARLASSGPNFQNVSVRRAEVGNKIRRAVVAPDGYYIYEADLSNAENRVYLHLAGYTDLPDDLHAWLRDKIGFTDDMPFSRKFAKPGKSASREATKSLTHGSDYGEGLSLITKQDLRRPNIVREVAFGARVVFPEWTFSDGNSTHVISFTGANLAERAFGDRSWESRKLALEAQEKYFSAFPRVRTHVQMMITAQIQRELAVRPPDGYCTLSYGPPADRIKTALAIWGSQPVAHITKLAMLRVVQDPWLSLRAQIHDALLMYVSAEHEPKAVKRRIEAAMVLENPNLPGLRIPIKVSYGRTWADQTEIAS